ncbi:hypothetical protein HPB48_026181 [Haemaphysalis longicornis]|uniref:HTH psq-type domain-containing protein n=1 Tax=Haemaphysalis longicornis TaxID=44386 RepID=A0A9J6HA60_HAELO|nr:hypothetical protein HPB48_026181 [Haemaphysalis longicornis]
MAPTPPVPPRPPAPSGLRRHELSRVTKKRGNYQTLTVEKKAAIIRQVESGRPQCEAAREFSVSKQTVSNYFKNKKIQEAVEKMSAVKQKNLRDGSHPKLEEHLTSGCAQLWLESAQCSVQPLRSITRGTTTASFLHPLKNLLHVGSYPQEKDDRLEYLGIMFSGLSDTNPTHGALPLIFSLPPPPDVYMDKCNNTIFNITTENDEPWSTSQTASLFDLSTKDLAGVPTFKTDTHGPNFPSLLSSLDAVYCRNQKRIQPLAAAKTWHQSAARSGAPGLRLHLSWARAP